jgi:cytochrome c oxidase cbb3-type subunit 2
MNRGMQNVWALFAACVLIYGALAILMAVVPGIVLSPSKATPGLQPFSAQQQRGREIYVGEGCSYCHTQNVRPLQQDLVFGRPSVAGDYAYATPQLLGTERTGPDLSNIGVRQPSQVWHFLHFWNPRSVVSDSIMPAYPWLFTVKDHADPNDVVVTVPSGFAPAHGVVVATQDAQALVAYLLSLKQVPLTKGASQ